MARNLRLQRKHQGAFISFKTKFEDLFFGTNIRETIVNDERHLSQGGKSSSDEKMTGSLIDVDSARYQQPNEGCNGETTPNDRGANRNLKKKLVKSVKSVFS